MGDEVQVTVIATGFEQDEQMVNPNAPPISGVFRQVPPRTQSVTPWGSARDPMDVPTAVREQRLMQEASEATASTSDILERDSRSVLDQQMNMDMKELERPAYIRKMAD